MAAYNYKENVRNDIMEYLEKYDDLKSMAYMSDFIETLVDKFMFSSVTVTSDDPESCVTGNWELLRDACVDQWIEDEEVGHRLLDGDFGFFDNAIRCYVLRDVLADIRHELLRR